MKDWKELNKTYINSKCLKEKIEDDLTFKEATNLLSGTFDECGEIEKDGLILTSDLFNILDKIEKENKEINFNRIKFKYIKAPKQE